MSTPMRTPSRIAISMPNSTNATKIDSSVKIVRTFRRSRLRQTSGRNFMRPPPSTSTPLSRCSVRCARVGRVRVVRDHDDRLAVLAVERLQQVEDLVAGLAIEVAGRLVAEQQRRVGDDRARDADALLLAAGELPRDSASSRSARPTTDSATCDALAPLGLRQLGQQQRQLDVSRRGQHRQQVVELEDEADVARPPPRQLAAGQLVDAIAADVDRAARSACRARRSD